MILDAEKQREEMAKQNALVKSQWQADLVWLMQHDAGKRICQQFIAESRKRVFTADERSTCYNLGRQEYARTFVDELRNASLALFRGTERADVGGNP
jgi:hypothetical protein